MQKAPVLKSSGLKPFEESKSPNDVVHVFGSNLEERVVAAEASSESSPSISSGNQSNAQTQDEDDTESIRKRKFDAITGEEDEESVFQGDFKLFVWDLATANWIEKGRGQLKLNDSIDDHGDHKSRLIMRNKGTLRIILNVSINPSHFRVIANTRSNIKFTDSQNVWAASGCASQQLKDLIELRLKHSELTEAKRQKKLHQESRDVTSADGTKKQDDDGKPTKPASERTNSESLSPPPQPPQSIALQPKKDEKNKPSVKEEKEKHDVKEAEEGATVKETGKRPHAGETEIKPRIEGTEKEHLDKETEESNLKEIEKPCSEQTKNNPENDHVNNAFNLSSKETESSSDEKQTTETREQQE